MITISPAVYRLLKKNIRIIALSILAESGKPMRRKDIMDVAIKQLNGSRLGDALDFLVQLGHVKTWTEHGAVLYQAVPSVEVQNVPCEVHFSPTLTLTEHEPTNKQDLEISLNTQAEGESSPPVATERVTAPSGAPDGAGQAAVSISSAVPAPVSPSKAKKPAKGGDSLSVRAKRTPPPENAGEPLPYPQVIIPGKLETSHMSMIANMNGQTAPDPDHKPKAILDPAPPIPMYEAFVKYIDKLWKLVLSKAETDEKLPYSFLIHRAAYMFVMETHMRTGEVYRTPEMFIEEVKRRARKNPMYIKMAGMLQDHYTRAGFHWDKTIVHDDAVYSAELSYAAYQSKELGTEVLPRDELFPGILHKRGLLQYRVDKAHQDAIYRQEAAEHRANQEKLQEENRLRAEQEKAAEKKRKEAESRRTYLTEIEKLKGMTASERVAHFSDYGSLIQVMINQCPPDLQEQYLALMPKIRKKAMTEQERRW